MLPKRLFLWSGLLLLSLTGLTLAWLFWSPPQVEHALDFTPQQMLPSAGVDTFLLPHRMLLTYPAWVRLGDGASIRLTFSPRPGETAPPAQNLYAIYAETHLDMPTLNPDPSGVAGQVLPPAGAVTFWWQLHPAQAGFAEGTAWLSLRFEPLDGSEPLVNALAAPRLSIPVRSFLGLGAPAVRWLCGFSALFGLLALLRFSLFHPAHLEKLIPNLQLAKKYSPQSRRAHRETAESFLNKNPCNPWLNPLFIRVIRG